MRTLTLGQVAHACGGKLHDGDANQQIAGVSTDSKATKPGDLFLALKGDRFDAHQFMTPDFVTQLTGAVVTQSLLPHHLPPFPRIDVPDVRKAMGRLAHWYRNQFDIPVIGITGSNGKTSTKALLKGALSGELSVLSSPASFNNDVGVPLTLLDLADEHEAAILEIGTNHPGEIAHLSRMVQPSIGIITSIGKSHLGHFGSVEAVAQEKGFLAEALLGNGILILNADSPWSATLAKRTSARTISVGFLEEADWYLSECAVTQEHTTCQIFHAGQQIKSSFRIPVSGKHQALNAGLAFAAAYELGLHPDQIAEGLESAEMPKMRMELLRTPSATLWNDAYNANEDSVIAAMETFSSVASRGHRKIMVLGTLNELGEHATATYHRLAEKAVVLGIDLLVSIGEEVDQWVLEAQSLGHPRCVSFDSLEGALLHFSKLIRQGDQVLFKASRGAKLEKLVEKLKEDCVAPSADAFRDQGQDGTAQGSIPSTACLAASAGGLFL